MKYYIEINDQHGRSVGAPVAIEITKNSPEWWIGEAARKTFDKVRSHFIQDLGMGKIDGIIRKGLLSYEQHKELERAGL